MWDAIKRDRSDGVKSKAMNTVNASAKLDERMKDGKRRGERLLLHSCCAPCSSYCLMYLRFFYRITVYYYNPNIGCEAEYEHRASEQIRFIAELNKDRFLKPDGTKAETEAYEIDVVSGDYEPEEYLRRVKGLEDCPERGARCSICFDMRLRKTAEYAKETGIGLFATTLTLSPLKNAGLINEIGLKIAEETGVEYLESDFKKKNGYLYSIRLSEQFGLYRQDFCGCDFSKRNTQSGAKDTKSTE